MMLANFSSQFDAAKNTLKSETFAAEWAVLLASAKKLLGEDGLDAAYESTLRDLRKKPARVGPRVLREEEGILYATGDYNPGTGQLPGHWPAAVGHVIEDRRQGRDGQVPQCPSWNFSSPLSPLWGMLNIG
jgi:hypothetical protein